MTGVPPKPDYNGKLCSLKFFKANEIAWFFHTKFLEKGFIIWIHFLYESSLLWSSLSVIFICMHKINSIPKSFFFLDIAKMLQRYYFAYLESSWSCTSIMIVWSCRKIWCLSIYQKSTSSLTSFLRYCKDIANLPFWEIGECLTISIKVKVSICRKLLCLYGCKKSTPSFTSFFRYCEEIANLIFWVISVCLAAHT